LREEWIALKGKRYKAYSLNTIIVGTGVAGFNAAERLYSFGQKDIAIVTEGLNKGTSRNTGSDKQTYYKFTLAGNCEDSINEMAETLFQGGSMDGDIALVEAAMSTQCFYHLVDIGVPFPHNRYGEYVGYKTDHDPRQRATSVGPLTSKVMTEKLQEQVIQRNIRIFDMYQVIGILTNEGRSVGLIALNLNKLEDSENRYVIFNCTNIIYATGGPAGIYNTSVYPASQTGASGFALEAGIKGKNLTESQYGIASIKFRWNLSGTYQQVLPRYISTDKSGNDEKEFLQNYFENPGQMLDAIFLKGYQWPFDARKVEDYGSSIIDILVYNETVIKGRRVFLDYTQNSQWGLLKNGEIDFSLLGEESQLYLKNSNALFGTPIDRLKHMNEPAIKLYMDHGIDIAKEYLEIAVCAQHNNGGLCGNLWWESNIKNFFPVGEVNGTHGIYRPGGTALNSGQVGSTRAAQYIANRYTNEPMDIDTLLNTCKKQIEEKINIGEGFMQQLGTESNVMDIRKKIGIRMTECGAHIRIYSQIEKVAKESKEMLNNITKLTKISSTFQLKYAFQNYDLLITQYVYLSSIIDYINKGGGSRGSYLICEQSGKLPVNGLEDNFKFVLDDGTSNSKIQFSSFNNRNCNFEWREVNQIPKEESWFENVWNEYMKGEIIR
jgi:succinate dehydrogenase/fumarate reductase flavoprotein subunit